MRFMVLFVLVLLPATAMAQGAITSPHGELSLACESCHTAEGWSPVRLDVFEHGDTGFDLEHAHTGLACLDCHASLEFGVIEPSCGGCHRDVHLGELGLDCARCHTTRTFIDAARQRDLHREATFPLTGAHAGADCEDCHVPRDLGDLQYLGTTTECYDCHRADYESTTDPDHVADDFSQDCEICHGTATFEDGYFNHEVVLAGTPMVCVDCHQDDYDQTTRPDHIAAGFPLDCAALPQHALLVRIVLRARPGVLPDLQRPTRRGVERLQRVPQLADGLHDLHLPDVSSAQRQEEDRRGSQQG